MKLKDHGRNKKLIEIQKNHAGKFKLFIVMMFLPCCVFQKPSWQMGPFKLKFKKTPILSISTTRCVRFQSRVTARVVHKEECLYSSPFFLPLRVSPNILQCTTSASFVQTFTSDKKGFCLTQHVSTERDKGMCFSSLGHMYLLPILP